jgi:hypothetical protein
MKKSGKGTPALKLKAKAYLAAGYQKLLGYEQRNGDRSFFTGYPAKVSSTLSGQGDTMMTAYGLQLFSDMQRVFPIAGGIIPRLQKWLLSRMKGDHWGAGSPLGAAAAEKDNAYTATGYITWTLLQSGLEKNNKKIRQALDYLEKNHLSHLNNPTALGYCALSLVKGKRQAAPVLERLNGLARNDGNGVYWTAASFAPTGTTAAPGDIETTAIAALANLETGNTSLDIMQVLYYLLMNKKTTGTWGNTQATVLTLKVLTYVLPGSSQAVFGKVNVILDNNLVKEILFKEDNNIFMQVVDLQGFAGKGSPEIVVKFQGRGELFCQVLSSYYLKWDDPLLYRKKSPLNLDLTYDKQRLQQGEVLNVKATTAAVGKDAVNFAIVDIGIPPGFKAGTGEFREMRARGLIDRYEIDGGRIVLYLHNLDRKGKEFRFGMQAITEAFVKTPIARVYDYYNPQVMQEVKPVQLTVI